MEHELSDACEVEYFRSAWFLARKVAGTGVLKHKRFIGDLPPSFPSVYDWIRYVCLPGPDVGMQAKLIAPETPSQMSDDIKPFPGLLQTNSDTDSLETNLQYGGGPGQRIAQSLTIRACIGVKKQILMLIS